MRNALLTNLAYLLADFIYRHLLFMKPSFCMIRLNLGFGLGLGILNISLRLFTRLIDESSRFGLVFLKILCLGLILIHLRLSL